MMSGIEWSTSWSGWAALWAGSLWRTCWQGTLFMLSVWVVCRLCPRLPAPARCWLWWLACLKLVVGLVWMSPLPLPLLPTPVDRPAPSMVTSSRPPRGPVRMENGTSTGDASTRRGLRGAATAPVTPHPAAAGSELQRRALEDGRAWAGAARANAIGPPWLATILLELWLVGVGLQLWRTGRQWNAARRLWRGARPLAGAEIQEQVRQLGALMGLRRPPSLLEAPAVSGPLVMGLFRPAVLLPEAAAEQLSSGELRMALAHELAHLQRGDLLLALVPGLAQTLFFFHPLVWFAGREWAMAREAACDAAALQATGAPAAAYGRLLLKLTVAARGGDTAPALGATASYHTLQRRLKMLQQLSPSPRRWWRMGLIALGAIGAASIIPWRLTAMATPALNEAPRRPRHPGLPATARPVLAAAHMNAEPVPKGGHTQTVYSVAFSLDGARLLSGSDDKTIKLWDLHTGTVQQTLLAHSSGVGGVALSSDGKTVASGGYDWSVRLWDAENGALLRTMSDPGNPAICVAFSPDGQMVASGGYAPKVNLWEAQTGTLLRTLVGHRDGVISVTFSPDGQTIASTSHDGTVMLWDRQTGALRRTLASQDGAVNAVAFSPDGVTVASAGHGKTVELWEAQSGQRRQTLRGHGSSVNEVAFSPDGKLLASGSADRTVKLWEARTGELQRTMTGHSEPVAAIAFSPDGQLLASGSGDATVRLWDTRTGALQRTLNRAVLFTTDPTLNHRLSRPNAAGVRRKRRSSVLERLRVES